jgi:hypothetical protein
MENQTQSDQVQFRRVFIWTIEYKPLIFLFKLQAIHIKGREYT